MGRSAPTRGAGLAVCRVNADSRVPLGVLSTEARAHVGVGVPSLRTSAEACDAHAPTQRVVLAGESRAHVGAASRIVMVHQRTVVGCARRDAAQVLAAAMGHCDDIRADRHELAARGLMASAALCADGKRDLVAGATLVTRSAKRETRQRQQR
jgi:hypothetical protein